jgi:ring-1,2-phenylacetyl-CoA epoxidase subunit PaaD
MVMDPEIPMVSVVELGIIQRVAVEDGGRRVVVTMTPTFTGCPALTAMREEIAERVGELGVDEVAVPISFDPPWTSDRIGESARLKMRSIGLEPPIRHGGRIEATLEARARCPYCGSDQTELENPFGPTLCRAIHYCRSCQQPFEQFKAL